MQDNNSSGIIVETDLVSGLQKWNQRNKKTAAKKLVCTSDTDFLNIHEAGEFSSLPCNDIRNMELLKKRENEVRNK